MSPCATAMRFSAAAICFALLWIPAVGFAQDTQDNDSALEGAFASCDYEATVLALPQPKMYSKGDTSKAPVRIRLQRVLGVKYSNSVFCDGKSDELDVVFDNIAQLHADGVNVGDRIGYSIVFMYLDTQNPAKSTQVHMYRTRTDLCASQSSKCHRCIVILSNDQKGKKFLKPHEAHKYREISDQCASQSPNDLWCKELFAR